MYVTPDRFRTMGLGIDLDDVEEFELRATLTRSSAMVDAHCATATLPQQHDFRGGTITAEQHEWRYDTYNSGVSPFRFYPWHRPVIEITAFRIFTTPLLYTEIQPDEIFINNSAGYVEVSSLKLTQYGVLGGVVNALVGMWSPVAQMDYTYGHRFAISGEFLEATDAWTYRAQNQWWVDDPAPVIYVDGVEETTGFTIDSDEGTVTFDDPQAAGTIVTADYTHRLPWQIGEATALIAAEDFGESRMRARGMSGVDTLQVGEITIRRTAPGGSTRGATTIDRMSPRIETLLAGFTQMTAR